MDSNNGRGSLTSRYLTALLAPAVITGAMQVTWPFFQHNPASPYLLAVVFCAWYGGLRLGLLSVVISFLLTDFLFIEPYGFFWFPNQVDRVRLLLFAVVSSFISVMTGLMRRERRRAGIDLEPAVESLARLERASKGEIVEFEYRIRHRHGEWRFARRLPVSCCRTAEIERLAHFDTLTDMPNRLLFEDRLSQALNRTHHEGQILGILLMRVDGFNKLNDTLGHALSDRLLCDIAQRIRGAIGERGTVARFEGDEFALLLADHGSEKVIEALGDVNEALKLPFGLHEHELFITTSIGVSLFPVDGKSVQELLKHAAVALNRALSLGGNNYQFYEAQMNARALERLTMEASLRRAVKNNEFKLHYQPQFDLRTQQMVGAEALIRWQHPKLGLIPPAKFIPLAERPA